MHATTDENHGDPIPESVQTSWQYAQELWSSDSTSEGWASFKNMISALPGWALALLVVALFGLFVNSWILLIPLAAGGFLTATYYTVKRAILSALREHDSQQRY